MTDIKPTHKAPQDDSNAWDQEVRNLWPKNYPESLSKALKDFGVSTILDCAGGTGFPSIELKEMGWDVNYSDASDSMISFFDQKTKSKSLDIPMYKSKWETLSGNIPNRYDALMCSGNSISNINTYDSESTFTKEAILANIKLAAKEFYTMLNNGGVLYIDLYTEECAMPKAPYSVATSSATHRVFRTISYDPVRNIRLNLTTMSSLTDDSEFDTISKTIPIVSEELIGALLEAGFSRVERAAVSDADYVDSFFAFKD
jgi:SAM-dependent methyltransferase